MQAVQHRGTALIDILQPCPIYNDLMTIDFFRGRDVGHNRIYRLADEGFDGRVHDPSNQDEIVAKQQAAIAKSFEWGDRIPTGCSTRSTHRRTRMNLLAACLNWAPIACWIWPRPDRTSLGLRTRTAKSPPPQHP